MPLNNKNILLFLTIGLLAIFSTGAYAQSDVAAADVDARLRTLEAQVQSLMANNWQLRVANSQQQQQIAQLQASSVNGLSEFVSVDVDQHGRPAVFFDAVNLYVRDGSGRTGGLEANQPRPLSGLGNIILGYNETALSNAIDPFCTSFWSRLTAEYLVTEADCTAEGFEWTTNNKTGTHNLIIGFGHNYSGEGNIVVGNHNSVSDAANIVSGRGNYAGMDSVVLGSNESKAYWGGAILASEQTKLGSGAIISSFFNEASGWATIIDSRPYNRD